MHVQCIRTHRLLQSSTNVMSDLTTYSQVLQGVQRVQTTVAGIRGGAAKCRQPTEIRQNTAR